MRTKDFCLYMTINAIWAGFVKSASCGVQGEKKEDGISVIAMDWRAQKFFTRVIYLMNEFCIFLLRKAAKKVI